MLKKKKKKNYAMFPKRVAGRIDTQNHTVVLHLPDTRRVMFALDAFLDVLKQRKAKN